MVKPNKNISLVAFLRCLNFLISFKAEAQKVYPQRAPSVAQTGRLVAAIIIDQFRYDYLERFGDLFTNDGFRRLINRGQGTGNRGQVIGSSQQDAMKSFFYTSSHLSPLAGKLPPCSLSPVTCSLDSRSSCLSV